MAKEEELMSESDTAGSSGSENEPETLEQSATEYEKQRQSGIAANKARMEALGLRTMADSFMASPNNTRKAKGKSPSKRVALKKDEDDEYNPNDDDNGDSAGDFSSSDEEFDGKNVNSRKPRTPSGKVSNGEFLEPLGSYSCELHVKGGKSKSMKEISMQKSTEGTEFMDEDQPLMQAIALSLKDCEPQGSNAEAATINEKEDNMRRRKRKSLSSRVQMTADDLIIHFCQFDEIGKGSITLRDLQRMAAVHDFTWTDKEFVDMIRCFDGDKDGKLTLDDFRTIAMRCNMFQEPENPCR